MMALVTLSLGPCHPAALSLHAVGNPSGGQAAKCPEMSRGRLPAPPRPGSTHGLSSWGRGVCVPSLPAICSLSFPRGLAWTA